MKLDGLACSAECMDSLGPVKEKRKENSACFFSPKYIFCDTSDSVLFNSCYVDIAFFALYYLKSHRRH